MDTPQDLSLYWKTLVDTLQEGLLIISPAGRIILVNRAAEQMTGYTATELLGQICTILECTGCKLFTGGPGQEWCELFKLGRVDAKRCVILGKGGVKINILKQASILKDENGKVIGAVEALTDITGVIKTEREIFRLRQSLAREDGFFGLIGSSAAMKRVWALTEEAAKSEAAIMITGESGTGKELVARAVHKLSHRAKKPFIKVDCVAFNDNVLESELFGHIKGAYTGADRTRVGRFELAEGGVVFLDEVGDLPLSTQVKLLRVLEEKVIERVGDNRTIEVDVKIITATNRNLRQRIQTGLFREDLYYRINVVPITVPPLRDRREDIPILAQTFVDRLFIKTGRPIHGFTPEAMTRLYAYSWPGNVRELRNVVEYAFVVRHEGLIQPADLPEVVLSDLPLPANGDDDKHRLISALRKAKGNQSEAARILGVSRMTIWKWLKKYGLNLQRDVP